MKTFRPSDGTTSVSVRSADGLGKAAGAHKGRAPAPEELILLARKVYRARASRKSFLAGELFSEPGWEMLLALFEADAAGHRLTISNLCYASQAPDTTALRWLEKLCELGLVYRKRNPLDSRMVFVELEPKGRTAVRECLVDIWMLFYGPA